MALHKEAAPHWILLLSSFSTWHCGCENEKRLATYVYGAYAGGYLTKRKHYAQAFPEGIDAWELTDKALILIGLHIGFEDEKSVRAVRQWYRDHSSTLEKAQASYLKATGRSFDATGKEFGKKNV